MKKTLSIILSLVMIITTLCALPFAAKADEDRGSLDWHMTDSFDKSWNGANVRVYDKTTGSDVCTMEFEDGESEHTGSLDLPYEHTYQFIWVKGTYDDECGFYLSYRGVEIISKGMGTLTNVADGTVLAEYELTKGYNLWIGTTLIKKDNAADVFGDGKVKFNHTTNTLTLDNFTFEGKGVMFNNYKYAGILWDDYNNELAIEVKGNNKIKETEAANHSDADTYGIISSGSLKFTGSGTLDVECCDADSFSAAIVSWCTLTIPATFTGAINAVSGKNEASSSNIGIYGSDGVTISGGTVTAVSYPAASNNEESVAVFSWGTVSLGANVTATASVNTDGSAAVAFKDSDKKTYKWFKSVYTAPSAPIVDTKLNVDGTSISTVSDINKKTLSVSWKKVAKATDYEIEYRKAGATKWTSAKTKNKTAYTIKNLAKGGCYEFHVRAVRTAGDKTYVSKWSNISRRYIYKATVSKLTAGKKQFTVQWGKDKNATSYEIIYSTDKSFKKGVKKVTAKKSATKATVKKLTKGKTYYVRVRSVKKVGGASYVGEWSAKKSIKVK